MILFALHYQTAPVLIHDFCGNWEAQTDPAGLGSEKRIKYLLTVFRPYSAAKVDHSDFQTGGQRAGFHRHHPVGGGGIGGILDQVEEHPLEQGRVAMHGGQRRVVGAVDGQLAGRILFLKMQNGLVEQGMQIDFGQAKLKRPCELQEACHQEIRAVHFRSDVAGQLLRHGVGAF